MFDPNDKTLSPRKRRVLDFMNRVLHGTEPEAIDEFVRPDYIQHTPGIGQGRDGLRRYFEQVAAVRPNRHIWKPIMMFEEGDIVTLIKWLPRVWICVIIRFDDADMMAEHWDIVQAWPQGAPDFDAAGDEDLSRFQALFNLSQD